MTGCDLYSSRGPTDALPSRVMHVYMYVCTVRYTCSVLHHPAQIINASIHRMSQRRVGCCGGGRKVEVDGRWWVERGRGGEMLGVGELGSELPNDFEFSDAEEQNT